MGKVFNVLAVVAAIGLLVFWYAGNEQADNSDEATGESRGTAGGTVAAPEPAKLTVRRVEAGGVVVDGSVDDWSGAAAFAVGTVGQGDGYDTTKRMIAGMAEEKRWWRKVAFQHDGKYLYLLFELSEGIEERYNRTHSTGALGYIQVDTDHNEDTGIERKAGGLTAGCDYSIWLPVGFSGGTGHETIAIVCYEITRFADEGSAEEVEGGERSSHTDPEYVAIGGEFVEMKIALDILGIEPPSKVRFHLDSFDFGTVESIIEGEFE